MIHVMDPNSNINYCRKIAPKYVFMKDNILSLNQYRKNPPLSGESLTKDCPWYGVDQLLQVLLNRVMFFGNNFRRKLYDEKSCYKRMPSTYFSFTFCLLHIMVHWTRNKSLLSLITTSAPVGKWTWFWQPH